MVQDRDALGDDSRPRTNRQNPSPWSQTGKNVDEEWEELEVKTSARGGLGGMIRKIRHLRWIEKNPNLFAGIAGSVLLLLLLLPLGWYLGWFNRDTKQAGVAAARPTVVAPATQPQQQPQSPGLAVPAPTPAKPSYQPPVASNPALQKPPEPLRQVGPIIEPPLPLPEDLTKWKKEDLLRARKENHPKLLEAIARFGEKARGSGPAAQSLCELLKPLPPEPPSPVIVASPPGTPPPSTPPRTPADVAKLVETVIAVLGDSGSDLARKTIEQILSGALPTEDDKAAVEAALKALAAHPGPANDALLLRAMTEPDALRPAERQGPWPARELRLKAFELLKPVASSELRAKLAEALTDRLIRLSAADPIREFLLASDPLNCSAQVVLYEKADLTKEVRTKLEAQLAAYSIMALTRLLEIHDETQAAAAANPTAGLPGKSGMDLGSWLAEQLWSAKFCSLVESQLNKVITLDKQPQLLLLAATIPQDSVRAALSKLVRKHWLDGPKFLTGGGSTENAMVDPGLLVWLKTLPRKDAKAASRGNKPGRGSVAPGSGKVSEAAQKKEQAQQEWMGISSKLTAAWCKSFCAAGQAKARAAAESGRSAGDAASRLPADFALGDDAQVIAEYHVLWPDQAPAGLKRQEPSLLEIYYVRAEETNKLKKAIGFYARQARAGVSDSQTVDKTTSLDSLRTDLKTGRRRSVDVLIGSTDSQAGGTAKDDEAADLTVEILIIETKNSTARE